MIFSLLAIRLRIRQAALAATGFAGSTTALGTTISSTPFFRVAAAFSGITSDGNVTV
jgi:hypothetical protein